MAGSAGSPIGRWEAVSCFWSLLTLFPHPQQIMKDKWINIGYEGEELKPYTEPEEDFGDTKRIGEKPGCGGEHL